MIDLTLTQPEKYTPGRRPSPPEEVSAHHLKQEATRLLTSGLSPQMWKVLDWLSVAGVMSAGQLEVSTRTLQRYTKMRLLDRLRFSAVELRATFRQYNLPYTDTETHLYVLAPVGLEIVSRRHSYPPLTGYLSYSLKRIMHDVILNEIVIRLAKFASGMGWRISWMGTGSATLFDPEKTRQILEPDALLIFQKDNQERRFCLEYHNEDKQTRAEKKVYKYHAAYEGGTWQQQWETETFPIVLAVFEKRIVGLGYQSILKGRKSSVTFCGKLLAGVLQDNLAEWAVFATGERLGILN